MVFVFILLCAGLYFRRVGCWVILIITGLVLPPGYSFVVLLADGPNAHDENIAIALCPYSSIAANFFFPYIFWSILVIPLQFLIYGIGACFAYRSKMKWRNLAGYFSVVAVIHALAAMYALHISAPYILRNIR
jgi:hypothetical protein